MNCDVFIPDQSLMKLTPLLEILSDEGRRDEEDPDQLGKRGGRHVADQDDVRRRHPPSEENDLSSDMIPRYKYKDHLFPFLKTIPNINIIPVRITNKARKRKKRIFIHIIQKQARFTV